MPNLNPPRRVSRHPGRHTSAKGYGWLALDLRHEEPLNALQRLLMAVYGRALLDSYGQGMQISPENPHLRQRLRDSATASGTEFVHQVHKLLDFPPGSRRVSVSRLCRAIVGVIRANYGRAVSADGS